MEQTGWFRLSDQNMYEKVTSPRAILHHTDQFYVLLCTRLYFMGCLPLKSPLTFVWPGVPKQSATTAPSSWSECHLTVFCIDVILPGYVVSLVNRSQKSCPKLHNQFYFFSVSWWAKSLRFWWEEVKSGSMRFPLVFPSTKHFRYYSEAVKMIPEGSLLMQVVLSTL